MFVQCVLTYTSTVLALSLYIECINKDLCGEKKKSSSYFRGTLQLEPGPSILSGAAPVFLGKHAVRCVTCSTWEPSEVGGWEHTGKQP